MLIPIAAALAYSGYSGLTLGNTITASNHGGTITMPASINAGDIIIVAQFAMTESGATPAAAYGTDFDDCQHTQANSYDPSGDPDVIETHRFRMCLSAKVAGGSEGETAIGGFMNGVNGEVAIVTVYNATAGPASGLSVVKDEDEFSADNASSSPGSVTKVLAGSVLTTIAIALSGRDATSMADFTTFAPSYDDRDTVNNGDIGLQLAVLTQEPTGTDVVIDFGASTAGEAYSCYVEVTG
jgi:hypothetical protein